MRVFVTGGTGFVGSAIVQELIGAGHTVLGLARSAASAAALERAGAEALHGSLQELDSLRAGAAQCDGVIHTAFENSDLMRFVENSERERVALEAIGSVLAGRDSPLIVTSGFASVAPGQLATENDAAGASTFGRQAETAAARLAGDGVNAAIVRLPCVHGPGDRFTVPNYIEIARRTGVSAYVGDGLNRWPAVYNVDAARVYRLAAEQLAGSRPQALPRYHAVAEQGVAMKEVAEVIGRRLGVPVRSVAPEAAYDHFGLYGGFAQADLPASSAITRQLLGWQPTGPGLLLDIDRPDYFAG